MHQRFVFASVLTAFVAGAGAQDLTWQKDIAPLVKAQCGECHGADEPEYNDWLEVRKTNKKASSRMDTYPHFMSYVVWPATGAMQRRLDDGKGTGAGGKPGNMYKYLGDTEEERAKNLATIKKWLGEGAWNLNRWNVRGDVPGITKEQLDAVKAKY